MGKNDVRKQMEESRTGRRVFVVGAGAAGMMAAISAAASGAQVTLLDGMDRPGRKLLITGNGRCNLTNMERQLAWRYHGTGAALAPGVIGRFDAKKTREFFLDLGLLTAEKNGLVYPYTSQASSVLSCLLLGLRRYGVKCKWCEKVISLSPGDNGGWLLDTKSWRYEADAVILACGSQAAKNTGSDGSGYALAGSCGHSLIAPAPALVPLVCKWRFPGAVSGVRCRAGLSLYQKKEEEMQLVAKETGELQWTDYGVSGIAVFQLSRFVSVQKDAQFLLRLNLLPDFDEEFLVQILCRSAAKGKQEPLSSLFSGLLAEKLIAPVLGCAGYSGKQAVGEVNEAQLRRLVKTICHLDLPVTGTKSFDQCQVCAGGVDAGEVSADTLESLLCPDLYFAGEILDIDGPCGGYNLQWAWSSGHLAGCSAAAPARKPQQCRRTLARRPTEAASAQKPQRCPPQPEPERLQNFTEKSEKQ